MVRQVEGAQRQAHAVLLRHLKLLRHLQVERDEAREARPVGVAQPYEVLLLVAQGEGEATARLEDGRDGDATREADGAPRDQAVRHVEGEVRVLILSDDGRAEVAEVAVEVVEVAARARAHVGDEEGVLRLLLLQKEARGQLKRAVRGAARRAQDDGALPPEVEFWVDDVDVFGAARGEVRAQHEPGRDGLVEWDVPLQAFGDEPGVAVRAPEVERRDGGRADEHVREATAVNNGLAVRRVARHGARGVAREAAYVERNLVVEEADAAAHDRPLALEGRPREARARRDVALVGDLLVFVSQSEVEAEVGPREPAILHEADVLTVLRAYEVRVVEDDSLGQSPVRARDVDGARVEP